MSTPNVDPNALTGEPLPAGTPAAATQRRPPVWDSHPDHHRWDWVPELGGWVHDQNPATLCTTVAAIPEEWQPTYGYPPPHPRCLLGQCPCGTTRDEEPR